MTNFLDEIVSQFIKIKILEHIHEYLLQFWSVIPLPEVIKLRMSSGTGTHAVEDGGRP